jgi:hypothetical protein
MVSRNSALGRAVANWVRSQDMAELPGFMYALIQNLVLPLIVLLCCLGSIWKMMKKSYRYFLPPKHYVLHSEAMALYRKGRVSEALRDWTRLDQYGPAYLSRACHVIYMQQPPDTNEGLRILRQAQQLQLTKGSAIKLPTKEVQKMKLDAQAIVNGNLLMVDMNARLAKQEYLGITSL